MSKARGLADLGNAFDDGALSNRNLIINGAMQVAQRGTSFASPSNIYTLDRWFSTDSTGAAVTVTQDSDAPNGFTNSSKITVNTADTSLASNSACLLRQNIEGVNFSQCGFGSSQAKDVTVSFWVKSSVTGQYSVALNNSAYDRSYVTGYTISSANTWEYKSVSISGDTTGTWLTSFSIGAALHFPVAVEAGKITSGDAWTSGFNYGVTGQVNFVGTSSATFYITGVQLEVGDTATPFEHRSYGDELARCQRYYEKSYNQGTAIGTATHLGSRSSGGNAAANTTGEIGGYFPFIVTKRAAPSVTIWDQSGNQGKTTISLYGTGTTANQTSSVSNISETVFFVSRSSGANATELYVQFAADAEL